MIRTIEAATGIAKRAARLRGALLGLAAIATATGCASLPTPDVRAFHDAILIRGEISYASLRLIVDDYIARAPR